MDGLYQHNDVEQGFANKSDISLVYRAYSAQQAVDHILNYYKIFHSLRYIGNLTVIRLTKALPADLVKDLNNEFQDIIVKGALHSSPPHKQELQNNEYLDLPRLSLYFNKTGYGRLNQLILAINQG